ncbi:hypothetical protein [Aidingimonas halophila]|uniref:Lipoprotein n=1 Tax=Aidingimonas halophila TaxID=574349 RepID=A0A1H3A5V8_9GAMM|nr:hypothetical protein [Aidingimonas halophila]GHC21632.1 hypothetical protein GCM10008094_10460 [Aidingimonas halophila]SDX25003.1 hypothetical protein SAMN05443545_104366 [Aidingimonas halophila]
MKCSLRLTVIPSLAAMLLVAGCSYQPARFQPGEIRSEPLIEFDGKRHYHDRDHRHDRHYDRDRRHRRSHGGHGRGFCPPGLAKQGRC